MHRIMGYREVMAWYRQLSAEDQAEISKAIQKMMDARYNLTSKGKKDGPPVHDNGNK